jgi:hypothetical protein
MAIVGKIDLLVNSMPLKERQALLEKLNRHLNLPTELLYEEEDKADSTADFDSEFSELPLINRILYRILSVFKAAPPKKLFIDKKMSVLGKKIKIMFPGMYNYRSSMLLPAFYDQLTQLKEAAKFFYSALDASVNRDREAFFSFLGSLEMADVHWTLQAETDPAVIIEKYPGATETEQRQLAFKAMDDALDKITEKYRNIMYTSARTLFCLKELASFPFDRLLFSFNSNRTSKAQTCSVIAVKDLLESLNNILLSVKNVPSMTLFQSLFVFILQDRAWESKFDINQESDLLLEKAEKSLDTIREFNKKVPLTLILRSANKDLRFTPQEKSGGEDWFSIYRNYWRQRIEALWLEYSNSLKEQRRQDLLSSFQDFFKGQKIRPFENPFGMPIKEAFAFSFLSTFYTVVFMPDISKFLQPVFIDGDFKDEYIRNDFMESYNNLVKLEGDIRNLEKRISTSGEYGERYDQIPKDNANAQAKRRRMQLLTDKVKSDAESIMERIRKALRLMIDILQSFLKKDPYGKETLIVSNLPKFAEKDPQFFPSVLEAIKQLQIVLDLLSELEAIEKKK